MCVFMYMYAYMQTFTYKQGMHAIMHAYMHKCFMQTCMHAYKHARTQTNMKTNRHANIQMNMNVCARTTCAYKRASNCKHKVIMHKQT